MHLLQTLHYLIFFKTVRIMTAFAFSVMIRKIERNSPILTRQNNLGFQKICERCIASEKNRTL